MVKVTEPLFSSNTRGTIGGLVSFRRGQHGAEAIKPRQASRKKAQPGSSAAQIRAHFAFAKQSHSQLDPETRPTWPDYWNTYLSQL